MASETGQERQSNDLLHFSNPMDEQGRANGEEANLKFAEKSEGAVSSSHDNAVPSQDQQTPWSLQQLYTSQSTAGQQPWNSSHSCPWHHFSGVPIAPFGTIQASQSPNYCYQVGCPYPGLSGPWDPFVSWWAQVPQLHPPLAFYNYTAVPRYLSSQMSTLPNSSVSLEQCLQRGAIKPPAKLSQKHQRLWEAQSAENIQLWTVIGQLQSEIAKNKSQIVKLEAEISSLNEAVEKASTHVMNATLLGRAQKRGRPRRLARSTDAPALQDESQPPMQSQKLTMCKVRTGGRAVVAEKVILDVNREKNQAGANVSKMQRCEVGLSSRICKDDFKSVNLQNVCDVLSHVPTTAVNKELLASSAGEMNNGIGEQFMIVPGESAEETSSAGYDSGDVIRQSGKAIPG